MKNKIRLLIALQFILNIKNINSVTWQNEDWAFSCDFKNNDLTNVQISWEQCGAKCQETTGCTHFTWTSFNGGTCWMKKGSVSKSNAMYTGDKTMVCGIVSGIVLYLQLFNLFFL